MRLTNCERLYPQLMQDAGGHTVQAVPYDQILQCQLVDPYTHSKWVYREGITFPFCGHCEACIPVSAVFTFCPFCGAKMDEEVSE